MVRRHLTDLYDEFLSLLGIVRPGPAGRLPEGPRPRRATATPAELDAIGRRLGFVVSPGGLWRSNRSVVVVQLKSREAAADNDLPDRVAAMEADGRINDDDKVRAFYVYEEDTPAMQELFQRIVDDGRARHQPFLLRIDALRDIDQEVASGRTSREDARSVLFASMSVGVGSGP